MAIRGPADALEWDNLTLVVVPDVKCFLVVLDGDSITLGVTEGVPPMQIPACDWDISLERLHLDPKNSVHGRIQSHAGKDQLTEIGNA